MPRVVAVPDKFRGTLSAAEAAQAIAQAAGELGWECDVVPVSDGGEGFLDVFLAEGATRRHSTVRGPFGQPVEAEWLFCRPADRSAQTWAVIESAQAAGLSLVGGAGSNDPVRAGTAGVGQLIDAAVWAGASQVIVGMGGSASTDGGLGAVEALEWRGPASAEVVVACDVQTRFCDAAAVFSPQKGATREQVELLRERLCRLAQLYQERCGADVRDLAGGGAAGGLAGGLAALGARLVPGLELVSERLELAKRIARADLVVTGEGYLDRQSFAGKVVGGVLRLARHAGVPVLVVAGDAEPGLPVRYVSLVDRFGAKRARVEAAACLKAVVADRLGRGRGA